MVVRVPPRVLCSTSVWDALRNTLPQQDRHTGSKQHEYARGRLRRLRGEDDVASAFE